MNERKLSASMLTAYDRWLRQEERADATREKYLRSIRAFAAWLGGAAVTKDAVTEYLRAIACSRLGRKEEGRRHFLEACRLDGRMEYRGNLDPEIAELLKQ